MAESMPLRIAAIEFLNAAPLMWGLEADPRFALAYTLPSACADALRDGTADLGVIPAIELARIPGLVGLADLGVAVADHEGAEVRSILLVSRRPPAQVRTVVLDAASRTSAVLAQLLLRRRWGAAATAVTSVTGAAGAGWREALETADAVLLIGDPALQLRVSGAARHLHVYDLAQEWRAWTGLPFVFALWGIRAPAFEAHRGWLLARLHAALAAGLEASEELVRMWAPRLQIAPAEVRRYLADNVAYRLTAAHHHGLRRFVQLAAQEGWIEGAGLPELVAGTAVTAPASGPAGEVA
ncbi:MAG TPA: menaquinone biosynthesis protein [Terriglobales bacterium]